MPTPARVLAIAAILILPLAGETVQIRSSMDGAPQPAILDMPAAAGSNATPLLVHLHSWSTRFDNSTNLAQVRAEAAKRGWIFLSPDFRGANDHPAACGSELSVQDVLDAVEWVKTRAKVDERRIYLVGVSGGGYMSLMMAGRAPRIWAAVSAWVPITDLAAWHEFSVRKPQRYAKDMEACFSGFPPTHGFALQQYRRRSPVNFLELARGLPVDINTGIKDGHTGSVPVSHSLRAFNQLAAPAARVADADIEAMVRDAAVPARLRSNPFPEEGRTKPVLFRRVSNAARVTVFDGGHEPDFPAAVRWLEQQRKPPAAIHTTLQNDQLLPRQADGKASIPRPSAPATVETRVNGGPWLTTLPRFRVGGPYTIEHRAGKELIRRTGILVGDLYILAGQSNMVGRAPLVDPAPPDPRVRMLTPEDVWRVARDPVHEALQRDGRMLGIGLGLPFAKEMVRRTGARSG